ncbi:MAG: hypothetical protein AAF628_33050 [Planctomycetota bacterium]
MDRNDPGPRIFVTGAVLGVLLIATFVGITVALDMRSGFYGVPPNATWFPGVVEEAGDAPASADHGSGH